MTGNDIFELYDDFDGSSLDNTKWETNTSTYTLGSGYITLWGDWNDDNLYLRTLTELTLHKFIAEGRVKASTTSGDMDFFTSLGNGMFWGDNPGVTIVDDTEGNYLRLGDTEYNGYDMFTDTSFHTFAHYYVNKAWRNEMDNGRSRVNTDDFTLSQYLFGFGADTDDSSRKVELDWLRIRKYSPSNPVIMKKSYDVCISCYDYKLREMYASDCTLNGDYYNCTIDPDGNINSLGTANSYSVLCDMETDGGGWTVLADETYDDGTASGWSYTNDVTTCGVFGNILGGYEKISGQENEKTFSSLPPYETLRYSVDFIKLDSWDGESGYFEINDIRIFEKAYSAGAGEQICGRTNTNWNEYKDHIKGEFYNIGNSITFTGGSTLNQAPNDESWALDNFKLMVR
jgi:hypothetical protein